MLDEYTLNQFLGKGTFGEVYLTKKRNSDFLYATKRMSKQFVENEKYIKYFNNEISILKKLYHKNIVRLEELKKTTNHYYVIMEYCNGGSLTDCLEKYKNIYHRPFTEEIVQHIMRQIVSAVNYIHGLRIIHRDLKLDNILVKFENEIDKNQLNLLKAEVKIIDFGFAAYKDQNGLLKTAIGSPMNMDPLILKKFNSGGTANKELGYDEKADIWSLGTLCYQMLIGNCAFDAYNMKELVSKVEEGTYKVPTNLSKEVVSFLNAMLQYDPKKRLSASELIKHAFLIKNVKEFTRIDINQVSKKVYGGELKINIRENNTIWSIFNEDDEKLLNNIPGELFPTETPISESQYLNTDKNPEMISNAPFNLEKNFIDNEFKSTSSTPIEGPSFGKANSSPIPERINEENNFQNNSYDINTQQIFQTPMKQQAMPQFQANINNGFIPRTPQISPMAKNKANSNMVTLLRTLDNGQVITTQVPIEQLKIEQNGLKNNNQQVKTNLISKFQQNSRKELIPPQQSQNKTNLIQNNPNHIIQNNININQMNGMKQNAINAPYAQILYPHEQGPQPNMDLRQINQIMQNQNQIEPKGIQQNQGKANYMQNIPNNLNLNNRNQIQRNQISSKQNLNNFNDNKMVNNQIQNNLVQNKAQQNNKTQNYQLQNNQMLNRQIPTNIIQNNKMPINMIQNNQARINALQNNHIQRKQIPNNNIPQNINFLNQKQNNHISENNFLNQNQIRNPQFNQKIQTKQAINHPNAITSNNMNPPGHILKTLTIKQNQQLQQTNGGRSPQLSQMDIRQFQPQNAQISPLNQIQKNGIPPSKQIKTFQIAMNGKRINSENNINRYINPQGSPRKVVPQLNINNGNYQKIPLINKNNTPNLIQRRAQYLKSKRQLSQHQLRIYEQINKNQQNNLVNQQRLRNDVSPNIQKIGMRPALTMCNNFRTLNGINNY